MGGPVGDPVKHVLSWLVDEERREEKYKVQQNKRQSFTR